MATSSEGRLARFWRNNRKAVIFALALLLCGIVGNGGYIWGKNDLSTVIKQRDQLSRENGKLQLREQELRIDLHNLTLLRQEAEAHAGRESMAREKAEGNAANALRRARLAEKNASAEQIGQRNAAEVAKAAAKEAARIKHEAGAPPRR